MVKNIKIDREIEHMVLNVNYEKTTMKLICGYEELRLSCKNIKFFDIDTEKEKSQEFIIKYYGKLFEYLAKKIEELINVLDLDIFEAWEIIKKYETLAYLDIETIENIEQLEDYCINEQKISRLYDPDKFERNKYI